MPHLGYRLTLIFYFIFNILYFSISLFLYTYWEDLQYTQSTDLQ